MFFILAKTVGVLTVPSNALALAVVIGLLLLLTRFRRAGRRLLIGCFVVFVAVGVLPVGRVLIATLEGRFPPWTETASPPDGIIVLGGSIRPGMSRLRHSVQLMESAERLTVVPELARRYPSARIVVSGGNPSFSGEGVPEAAYAVQLLESFGIPRERLTVEDRSRDTAENARFTKALIEPKPGQHWLLVTSAAHMPRAMGCFREVGFPVEAYPVDWQTTVGVAPMWRLWLPSLHPLRGWDWADDAAKEWVGLTAYWLSGRIDSPFPGP